ncbi:hypothetical protein DFS34DRAFT_674424 [Phlyctochytrium arcticum]|nr:hypothetical protein DFS34DRAFT_674424 [Phlyctochytrium arcticum]
MLRCVVVHFAIAAPLPSGLLRAFVLWTVVGFFALVPRAPSLLVAVLDHLNRSSRDRHRVVISFCCCLNLYQCCQMALSDFVEEWAADVVGETTKEVRDCFLDSECIFAKARDGVIKLPNVVRHCSLDRKIQQSFSDQNTVLLVSPASLQFHFNVVVSFAVLCQVLWLPSPANCPCLAGGR